MYVGKLKAWKHPLISYNASRKAQGGFSVEEENNVSCFKSKHGTSSVTKLLNNTGQGIYLKLNSQRYSLKFIIHQVYQFIYIKKCVL